jgi:hypothetical protein
LIISRLFGLLRVFFMGISHSFMGTFSLELTDNNLSLFSSSLNQEASLKRITNGRHGNAWSWLGGDYGSSGERSWIR